MNTTRQHYQARQNGAVSLFVVIMSTLLMVIVTVSFVQLMLKDQRQAIASDLSQSAYDSAQSGVEDAKRLLLLAQQCQNNIQPGGGKSCAAIEAAVASNECNTVSVIFGASTDTETLVQQDPGDNALEQAYTCVKINTQTNEYKKEINNNESQIIPLKGVSAFDAIKISWFVKDDISATAGSMALGFPGNGVDAQLPRVGARWAANYPPLLRAQLMQMGGSFTLADFDAEKNASTLFLYPADAGTDLAGFTEVRRDGSQTPEIIECEDSFAGSIVYACSVEIDLPAPVDGNVINRNAYLRLSALYNSANYQIELLNGTTVVPFDGVQPEVDSTGRANDMFRRVKSRIEFNSPFMYPEAAVDIEGDLCKNFIITNIDQGYSPGASCNP